DRRNQPVWIAGRVHEDSPASQALLERQIHRHRRFRDEILVVDIRHHADDAPGPLADADELEDRVRPLELSVERLLVGEHALRETLAHDDHLLAVDTVIVREVAPGEKRNAERGEEAW